MSIQYKNRTFRLVLTRGHDTSHTDRTQRDHKNKYENKNHKVGRDEEVREVEILALLGLVAGRAGSRARPCCGQAPVSIAGDTQAQPNASAGGAHL